MVDTLRPDHLDVYGYERETAPNLRALAQAGVLFTDCSAQATWTKASSASLMTSLYPTSHGVADFGHRLPASANTLAETLRDAGYATLSLSSIMFTGKFSNLHQGFEVVHEAASLPRERKSKTSLPVPEPAGAVARAAPRRAFFVFLHVFDPHDPYRPQPPYESRWAKPEGNEAHPFGELLDLHIVSPMLRRIGMATRASDHVPDPDIYIQHMRDWYDGSIRAMDTELGRLRETLDNQAWPTTRSSCSTAATTARS